MSEFPKFELVIVIIEARKSKPMMLVCLQVLGYSWLVSCWWVKSALSLETNGNGSAMWKMIGLCTYLTALLQFPLQVLYGSYLEMVLRRLVWLYKQPTFYYLLFSSVQHYVMSFFVCVCASSDGEATALFLKDPINWSHTVTHNLFVDSGGKIAKSAILKSILYILNLRENHRKYQYKIKKLRILWLCVLCVRLVITVEPNDRAWTVKLLLSFF